MIRLAARELPGVAERVWSGETSVNPAQILASAEHAAKVLGDLRGLAMKVGQTVSYVDGLLPPDLTEAYQKALAKLQSRAPTVSFDAIRAEIERGLGRPIAEAYTRFDPEPLAAASIGQVHRAALIHPDTGVETEVAVKVQYPSIAQAVGSDLKNIEALRPLAALLAPGADTRGGIAEVIANLAAELDYVLEARNIELFRPLCASHPDMVIPRSFATHAARNVLTLEFMPGRSIRDVSADPDDALRSRVGVAIFKFGLGLALAHGVFNTDPHPGNYIVLADGRTAFLDFGSVKVLPKELHHRWRSVAVHLLAGNVDRWRVESAELFGLHQMDPRVRRIHQDFILATAAMVSRDAPVTIDRAMIRQTFVRGAETARSVVKEVGWLPSRARTAAMPPDFVMARRMQLGLFAVLAHLRPTANWNRILRAMIDASDPATD